MSRGVTKEITTRVGKQLPGNRLICWICPAWVIMTYRMVIDQIRTDFTKYKVLLRRRTLVLLNKGWRGGRDLPNRTTVMFPQSSFTTSALHEVHVQATEARGQLRNEESCAGGRRPSLILKRNQRQLAKTNERRLTEKRHIAKQEKRRLRWIRTVSSGVGELQKKTPQ